MFGIPYLLFSTEVPLGKLLNMQIFLFCTCMMRIERIEMPTSEMLGQTHVKMAPATLTPWSHALIRSPPLEYGQEM